MQSEDYQKQTTDNPNDLLLKFYQEVRKDIDALKELGINLN